MNAMNDIAEARATALSLRASAKACTREQGALKFKASTFFMVKGMCWRIVSRTSMFADRLVARMCFKLSINSPAKQA